LALFDQPEEEEVQFVPEETPAVDPVEVKAPAAPAVPKVSLDPTPPPADPAPAAVEPEPVAAEAVAAEDVQDLAMELHKAGQISREDLVTRLASYGGAQKISALDEAQLASFHAELLKLRGEANV
jgi:hypothetical protein